MNKLKFGLAGVGLDLFRDKLFIYVMLKLYTEFQCSTMPGTGQKVCGGVCLWGGCLCVKAYFIIQHK